MDILQLLTFFLINSTAASIEKKDEAAQSLLYTIRNFFAKQGTSLIISLSCEHEQTLYYFKDIIEIVYAQQENIKIKLVVNNHGRSISQNEDRISNVLLVDSFKSFLNLDMASKVRKYDSSEYYLILLQGQDEHPLDDIQQIFEYCWNHHLINVNIQVQEASGEIVIYSYFPFSKTHCGNAVPVEINRFCNGTMINDDLFPQKLLNMYNCPLRVATWTIIPFMKADLNKTGNDAVEGFEGKLLLQLSKQMNFKIHLVEPPYSADLITNKENRLGMLRTREADLSIGCFQLEQYRTANFTASDSYFQGSNYAVFLTNLSLTSSISALWFPYEGPAFHCLLAAFLATLCLFYSLTWIIEKCFGSEPTASERNVFLNFTASTLGLPSGLNLKSNFGQILFITWLLFTLVIRTGYGAIIYHFMRNNLFRRPPSNMKDIARLGYKFAFSRFLYDSVKDNTVVKDTGLEYVILEDKSRGGIFQYLEDHPDEKLVSVMSLILLSTYSVSKQKIGVLSFLKEPLLYHHYSMYFPKHSFLTDRVNLLLQRVISVGLFDVWVKEASGMSQFMLKAPPNHVTIGSKELENVYFLYLVMIGLSTLVFCFEIISTKMEFLRPFFERL